MLSRPPAVLSLGRSLLTAAFGAVLTLSVQAGSPRVFNAYPSAAQRGTEVEVVFSGSGLQDAHTVLFNDPGFTVTMVDAKGPNFKAKIKVASEVAPGEHFYRVVTKSGIADLRLFCVTPFPMVAEVEKKGEPRAAQEIPMNTTVYGRTQEEDEDYFVVQAKKGERITAQVTAARLQTQKIYDTVLRISKEGGAQLLEVDDTAFGRQDPIGSIVAPEDGRYVVMIKDSTNLGEGPSHYLLSIGNFVQPQAVYPAGGAVGEELNVTLLGDATGPITAKVKLPEEENGRWPLFAGLEQPSPHPNYVRVSPFPNVLEAEPNNALKEVTAAAAALPVAMNGVIEKPGDVDFFKFTAKKGTNYDFQVFARELRSPLDSVVSVYNANGGRIALNDDNGPLDSYLRFTPPADGEYFLSVADQLKRGGPLYVYRVEMRPVEAKLTTWLPEMVLNSSQERRAVPVPRGNRYATLLRVKRYEVAGSLHIVPEGLPPGVKAQVGTMDKSVDTVPVVFEADPAANLETKNFQVLAKLTEPPKDAPAVPSRVEHVVDVTENGNQKAFYTVTEDRLPIAVTDTAPVKITLQPPRVPVLKNGSIPLKVKVDRQGTFKGAVTLGLLYAPPGVGSPGTVNVPEGKDDGEVLISANGQAPEQSWKICVTATADAGGPVWVSSDLVDLAVAPPYVEGKIQRTFVDQGDSGAVTVVLDHKNPFEGTATLSLQGLPPGVTAPEQTITKDTKEVRFEIKAAPTSPAGQHRQLFCQFKLNRDGEEMTAQFAQGGVLRVDKASVAQK